MCPYNMGMDSSVPGSTIWGSEYSTFNCEKVGIRSYKSASIVDLEPVAISPIAEEPGSAFASDKKRPLETQTENKSTESPKSDSELKLDRLIANYRILLDCSIALAVVVAPLVAMVIFISANPSPNREFIEFDPMQSFDTFAVNSSIGTGKLMALLRRLSSKSVLLFYELGSIDLAQTILWPNIRMMVVAKPKDMAVDMFVDIISVLKHAMHISVLI